MAKFQLGSYEHKKLFCSVLMDLQDSKLELPTIDKEEKQRLQAIKIWAFAADLLETSAQISKAFANTATGSLMQDAIAQFGKSNRQVSKLLKPLVQGKSSFPKGQFKGGAADFKKLGHQLNLCLFLAGGLLELAQKSLFISTDVLHSLEKALDQQASQVIFFVNWLAFESQVNQKPEYELAGLLAIPQRSSELWAVISTLNRSEYDDNLPTNPTEVDYFMGQWTLSQLLEACEQSYQKRFTAFDKRLIRPTKLLKASSFARTGLGFWPQRTVQSRVSST